MNQTLCALCAHRPPVMNNGDSGPCGFDGETVQQVDGEYRSSTGRLITSCGYFRAHNAQVATCTTEGLAKLTNRTARAVRRHIPNIPGARKDQWGRWHVPIQAGVTYINDRKPGRPTE